MVWSVAFIVAWNHLNMFHVEFVKRTCPSLCLEVLIISFRDMRIKMFSCVRHNTESGQNLSDKQTVQTLF